ACGRAADVRAVIEGLSKTYVHRRGRAVPALVPTWSISIWSLALAVLCLSDAALAQPPDALERARQLDAEIVQHYRDGHYAEAIPLAREAVALREGALGPNHPDVGRSLNNLAQLLLATGDYAGARPLAERALRVNEP